MGHIRYPPPDLSLSNVTSGGSLNQTFWFPQLMRLNHWCGCADNGRLSRFSAEACVNDAAAACAFGLRQPPISASTWHYGTECESAQSEYSLPQHPKASVARLHQGPWFELEATCRRSGHSSIVKSQVGSCIRGTYSQLLVVDDFVDTPCLASFSFVNRSSLVS